MSSDKSYYADRKINWAGELLYGKYVLINKLGHGSYATVWSCYDCQKNKYCAIKISNLSDYKYGKIEAKKYEKILNFRSQKFTNIIDSFEHDTDDGIHYCFTMDLMADSLYDFMDKYFPNGLPFNTVMNITHQILEGLSVLHNNGIIHADVKPENILISGMSTKQKTIFENLNIEKIIKSSTSGKNLFKNKTILHNVINQIKNKLNVDNNSDSMSNSDSDCDESLSEISDDTNTDKSFDLSDDDTESYYNDDQTILDDYAKSVIQSPIIKLADLGSSLDKTQKHTNHIQTCYYKAPEVLLRNGYNYACDMWSLGCMIYELLTGKILFDPDDSDGNIKKYHLYLMAKKLGMMPKNIMKSSPKRHVYFTADLNHIKGHNKIRYSPLINDLNFIADNNKLSESVRNQFIDFIMRMFKYDDTKRLTANEALKHDLFTNKSLRTPFTT